MSYLSTTTVYFSEEPHLPMDIGPFTADQAVELMYRIKDFRVFYEVDLYGKFYLNPEQTHIVEYTFYASNTQILSANSTSEDELACDVLVMNVQESHTTNATWTHLRTFEGDVIESASGNNIASVYGPAFFNDAFKSFTIDNGQWYIHPDDASFPLLYIGAPTGYNGLFSLQLGETIQPPNTLPIPYSLSFLGKEASNLNPLAAQFYIGGNYIATGGAPPPSGSVMVFVEPNSYWEYDPGDGGGPIYDGQYGSQLRDPFAVQE